MILSACGQDTSSTPTYIYVASGTAFAGLNVTMSTPTNVITKYNSDGTFNKIVRDYSLDPNDSPVALADYNSTYLLALVQNTASRRIELIAKDGSSYSTFLTNSTAFVNTLRAITATPDGGWLVSRSNTPASAPVLPATGANAIEKFNSSKTRVTISTNPYITTPGGTCATSTTMSPRIVIGPSNHIVVLHTAASPNNLITLINSAGYSSAADCIASRAGPTANHLPTAALYHSGGKLFVAFGNNTGPVHEIYNYAITASSIPAGTSSYSNTAVLQGISQMREMPDTTVLVASSASTFNTIERFSVSGGTLTRIGTSAFIPSSIYTRSISDFIIGY